MTKWNEVETEVEGVYFNQSKRHDVHTCGGRVRTVYHRVRQRWVRSGRMCFRCLEFWPDEEYFSPMSIEDGLYSEASIND